MAKILAGNREQIEGRSEYGGAFPENVGRQVEEFVGAALDLHSPTN